MQKEEFEQFIESWENLSLVVANIHKNPEYLDLLMDVALNSPNPKSWRAAWMADKINESNPDLINPYIPLMISKLSAELDGGKKRHFMKLISFSKIPSEQYGFLLDFCLDAFTNAKEAIAVRVHTMQILYNISQHEPDFQHELIQIIEHEIEFHPSAGIISRGTKLIKKLRNNAIL